MKKIIFMFILLSVSVMVFATPSVEEEDILSSNKFSVGQDVFCSVGFAKTELEKSKSYAMHYGVKVVYEHEIPGQWYFGLSSHYAPGLKVYTCEPRTLDCGPHFRYIGCILKRHKIHSTVYDLNSSANFGYCLKTKGSVIVIPFVSLGVYYNRSRNMHSIPEQSAIAYKSETKEKYTYCSLGIKNYYEVANGFKIGLQAKVNRMIEGKITFKDNSTRIEKKMEKRIGYDMSTPMNFELSNNGWGIALEPYFSKIDYRENASNFGARIAVEVSY